MTRSLVTCVDVTLDWLSETRTTGARVLDPELSSVQFGGCKPSSKGHFGDKRRGYTSRIEEDAEREDGAVERRPLFIASRFDDCRSVNSLRASVSS